MPNSMDKLVTEIRPLLLGFFLSSFIHFVLPGFISDASPGGYLGLLWSTAILAELIAEIAAAIFGWLLFYKSSIFISLMFEGKQQQRFQLKLALTAPVVLSVYFIKDVEEFYLRGLFASYESWFIIIPLIILYYVGIRLIAFENFDGIFIGKFLGASIVLFILCWFSRNGYIFDADEGTYIDKKLSEQYSVTGQHMMKYLGMVSALYLGMYYGIRDTRWFSNSKNKEN
ncbi:MAG: hypothetical protein HOB18_03910 [Nitrospina sp.]|nr:hypothetical protein [Nitrospina sp.]